MLQHANPYLTEPLHSCEVSGSLAFFVSQPHVTVPDPLPPYAIVLFTPLSVLPHGVAAAIWWPALVIASLALGYGIAKITGLNLVTSIAASCFAVLGESIFPGALASIPISLVVFAALALRNRKWDLAAVLLGFAMIEPHMVLPACMAAFVFVPEMRTRLIGMAVVLGLLAIAAVGPHGVFSYFVTMLPLHALSEVNSAWQYSLTAFLYHLGVGAVPAVRAGSLQYVIFAIASVFAAGRLYCKNDDYAWLILVPSAFAVIGGPYIHLDQVAMVIPLSCLMLRACPSKIAAVVLIILAIPVEASVVWLPFAMPAALVCSWLVAQMGASWKSVIASGSAVVGLAAMDAFLVYASRHPGMGVLHMAHAVFVPQPRPNLSASISWAQYIALTVIPPIWWPQKMLTIIPALVLLGMTLFEAFVTQRSVAYAHAQATSSSS